MILKGTTASIGTCTGKVRVVNNPALIKNFKDGDILVAAMTNPDYVPFMRRAAAVITANGGVLCHAAIVSREMKVPCIVAVKGVLDYLSTGMLVTVKAEAGSGTIEWSE